MLFPILMIVFLIFIHEFGHYIVARHYGMAVKVFSVGFGPSWCLFTDKNGTEWRLSLIPLGGYAQFVPRKEYDAAHQTDFVGPPTKNDLRIRRLKGLPFDAVSLPKRLQVILAGPVVNLLAFYPLVLGFLLMTSQVIKQNEVVVEDWAYELIENFNELESNKGSGRHIPLLQSGDRITEINGTPVLTPQSIKAQIELARLQGIDTLEIIVDKRYATQHEYEISLNDATNLHMIVDYKPSESLSNAYRILSHDLLRGVFQGFYLLPAVISHQISRPDTSTASETNDSSGVSDNLAKKSSRVNQIVDSPVMMVKHQTDVLSKLTTFSDKAALILLAGAFITLGLGFFNLLPLSILDGGQVVLNILDKMKEDGLLNKWVHDIFLYFYHLFSIVFLLVIMVLSIGGDIFTLLS